MDILEQLYNYLEDDPANITTRELILDAWIQLGDQDMAVGVAREIQELDPSNTNARTFLARRAANGYRAPGQASSSQAPTSTPRTIQGKKTTINLLPMPKTAQERSVMESAFAASYTKLRDASTSLLGELQALSTISQVHTGSSSDCNPLEDLQNLIDGKLSTVISRLPPRPVREVAREIVLLRNASPLDLIIADFEEVLEHHISSNPVADSESLRKRLLKRKTLLEAAVPAHLAEQIERALTHVEHERLSARGKNYANTETMLGDAVGDIPRANLLVTEDNYAWDMSELRSALTASSGVMRNPLTKMMFTPTDVRRILSHPLGTPLKPLTLAQSQLKRGVRPDTVVRLRELSRVILADQSEDARGSMVALDEFMVYMAALPAGEQSVLDELKVPGRDSHSGLDFDYTVGESVRGAKSARTCFHKTGDFLGQAARWLGGS